MLCCNSSYKGGATPLTITSCRETLALAHASHLLTGDPVLVFYWVLPNHQDDGIQIFLTDIIQPEPGIWGNVCNA